MWKSAKFVSDLLKVVQNEHKDWLTLFTAEDMSRLTKVDNLLKSGSEMGKQVT